MTASRSRLRALVLAMLCCAVAGLFPRAALAQGVETVRIRDLGPGRAGRWLRDALRQPHVLLRSDSANPVVLRRDTTYGSTVIVVGGPAVVAGTVRGDVFVVGGDLFLHPGVDIAGRAVAIGGGVYETMLGKVGGGVFANREFTYRVTALPGGSLALDYQALERRDVRVLSLPGVFGLRIPSYDRTNGLSVPAGPAFSFDTARIEIDALAVYRSQLGTVDPQLELRATVGRRLDVEGRAGRMTLSNDRWIYGDFANSLTTLFSGSDTRHYYRADRADARIAYRFEGSTATLALGAGALAERAWSARPDTGATGGPWSLFGRHDEHRMLRPNPRLDRGSIASALADARLEWADQGMTATADAQVELPWTTPDDARFVQTTLDARVAFPTFGAQSVEVESHAVLTAGDTAPPQRYAYLGGAGTLPTFELLEFGGDHLFFVEGRYIVPLDRVQIRYLGAPTVTLRYMSGAAGVGRLPSLEQNVGVRLAISLLRVDYVVDPASRKSHTSFGVSLFR